MKLSWLRSPQGKRQGVALFFGAGTVSLEPAERHALCDFCLQVAATMYCQVHACYVCHGCLNLRLHQIQAERDGLVCHWLSMALARELAIAPVRRMHVIKDIPLKRKAGFP